MNNRKKPPLHPSLTENDLHAATDALAYPSPTQLSVDLTKKHYRERRKPVDVKATIQNIKKSKP